MRECVVGEISIKTARTFPSALNTTQKRRGMKFFPRKWSTVTKIMINLQQFYFFSFDEFLNLCEFYL